MISCCRGFYRSSTGKWYIPDAVKSSAASKKDSRSGGMRSELKAGPNGAYELSFDIPAQLAPLFLAFELQSGRNVELNRTGQRFAVPVGMAAGRASRMGEGAAPFLLISLAASQAAPCFVRHRSSCSFRARHSTAENFLTVPCATH